MYERFVNYAAVSVLVALLGPAGCSGGGGSGSGAPGPTSIETLPRPVQTNDGWDTASLTDVGLDERLIAEAVGRLRRGDFNEIHSLLIVRHGKLVLEEYGSGRMYDYDYGRPDHLGPWINFDRDRKHIVHSVSKSYMSALIGIAIREGYLSSEEVSLLGFFTEIASVDHPGKADITLRHTMSMASGLQWNEWDVGPMNFQSNDALRFQMALDPPGYFFGKALIHEPGTAFYYNTAGFQMMGEVLRRATGMPVDQFAAQYLFGPLGVTDFAWPQFEHELVYLVGDLFLKPRDMARFGQLVLQHGEWEGRQLVPTAWLDEATSQIISVAHTGYKGYGGYGLHWWSKTFSVAGQAIHGIHADGLAGQAIMVFPSLDLVVVVTGGNYNRSELEHALVSNFVLPAASSR
jgi:CubicO group peptidase (beta-lactamase class C family)